MFIDNYEASENETDQEVAQTHESLIIWKVCSIINNSKL